MASKNKIKLMLDTCIENENDFAIIMTDTFDYCIYAVGCIESEFEKVYNLYSTSPMQRVMEVYDLNKNINLQLQERRSWHFPDGFKK